jgi:hypothetical protein
MKKLLLTEMDHNDRMNLKFLMEATEETLKDWYKVTSEDDHKYASALLTVASWEMLDLYMETDVAEFYLRKYILCGKN